jgi:hypothetical protein
MQIQINNYKELLEFIKRKDINSKQATEIVCKALSVICIFEMTKEELILKTENHINTFCKNYTGEHPIFLGQLSLDIDIKEIYKS